MVKQQRQNQEDIPQTSTAMMTSLMQFQEMIIQVYLLLSRPLVNFSAAKLLVRKNIAGYVVIKKSNQRFAALLKLK